MSRDNELKEVYKDVMEKLKENFPEEDPTILNEAYNKMMKSLIASVTLETEKRIDGRKFSDLRDISCSINLYKTLHGSAIFQRGQTQVLCTLALDSLRSTFKADPVTVMTGGLKEKNFMLHYDFPSFATNETGRVGVFGRREVGHGALAEKALRPAMPSDFPFTTRLNCEVLESNGSSSMASVCAGSLALMDGGVPVSHATAGVAMGLLHYNDNQEKTELSKASDKEKFVVLTDILGIEDYFGEMDFKIAGNKIGFTALQLDVKLSTGLPISVVQDALSQAHQAKKKILSIMNNIISKPNKESRENWPITEIVEIPPHRRSRLFGFGATALRKMTTDYGVELTQDDSDQNKLILFAPDKGSLSAAKKVISELIEMDDYEKNLEFKGIYTAKVVDIIDSGVKVVLFPGMDPVFIPNRELDQKQIKHPSAMGLQVGSEFKVKYFGRDPSSGFMRLSRRVLQALDPIGGNYLKNTDQS